MLWLFIRLQDEPTAASASGMLQQMTDGVNFIRHNELYRTFIGLRPVSTASSACHT